MKQLPCTYFRKSVVLSGLEINYKAGSIAVVPLPDERDKLAMLQNKLGLHIRPIDDFFTRYQFGMKDVDVFMHIPYGIGDIIALSSLVNFISGEGIRLTLFADDKYQSVFDWYASQWFDRVNFHGVITPDFRPQTRLTSARLKRLRRIGIEYAVHEGHDQNWYKSWFGRIGVDPQPEYCRPHLRTWRITNKPSDIPAGCYESIVVCHKSSCQMRSSYFQDFYIPIRQAHPAATICVHEVDLMDEDRVFIEMWAREVVILPKGDLGQMLLNLYDADLVVCTDTAACHFREGIGKPYLSVYGAFTTQSRTHHYLYGISFNTRPICPLQPCFKHETRRAEKCQYVKDLADEVGIIPDTMVAPCQSGMDFQEQLYNELMKL